MSHALLVVGTSANGKTFGLSNPEFLGLGRFSYWNLLLNMRSRGLLPSSPRLISRFRERQFGKLLSQERPRPLYALLDWDLSSHLGGYGENEFKISNLEDQIASYPYQLDRFLEQGIIHDVLKMFDTVQVVVLKDPRNHVSDLYWWRKGTHPPPGHTNRCWLYPDHCSPELIGAADKVYDLIYERLHFYLESITVKLARNGTICKIVSP